MEERRYYKLIYNKDESVIRIFRTGEYYQGYTIIEGYSPIIENWIGTMYVESDFQRNELIDWYALRILKSEVDNYLMLLELER